MPVFCFTTHYLYYATKKKDNKVLVTSQDKISVIYFMGEFRYHNNNCRENRKVQKGIARYNKQNKTM